jgi:hypothetical protein
MSSRTRSAVLAAAFACTIPAVIPGEALAANGASTSISVSLPAPTYVYSQGRYTLTVGNSGNRDASNTRITISLPSSQTSPQVYVMGTLGARSASCTVSGLTMTCNLGTLRRGRTASVFFDIALPVSTASLNMNATVSTTTADLSPGNNTVTIVPPLKAYDTDIAGAIAQVGTSIAVDNDHCTGTDLVSFFQCTLFPSSLSSHAVRYYDDGSIGDFPEPGYTGTWSQPNADELHVVYSDFSGPVMDFVGFGVDGSNCFHGITTFLPPGSGYNSAYQICLQ